MNIISAWGNPTNPAYNPHTDSNGGGYWQYVGGIVADIGGQLVTVEVDDMSCGDFGSRVYVDVLADGFTWYVCIGTMDDASIYAAEEIDAIYTSISGVLGVDADTLIREAIDAASLCARSIDTDVLQTR